ncbi:unnamed protein product [Gemmataceae bacterium]|nr:unnamed protein product [Gemmataceae bacterium]VTU01797.1 unnamed protein product [Gemmataceae bacterium]
MQLAHPELARQFYQCALDRLGTLAVGCLAELGVAKADLGPATEMLLSMVLIGPLHATQVLRPQAGIRIEDFRGTRLSEERIAFHRLPRGCSATFTRISPTTQKTGS